MVLFPVTDFIVMNGMRRCRMMDHMRDSIVMNDMCDGIVMDCRVINIALTKIDMLLSEWLELYYL